MTVVEGPTHHERKRLGQYFTGPALSRLLAELADAGSAGRVIDPMAGSGDLLVAAHERGGGRQRLDGVEIDHRASETCRQRLATAAPHARVQAANAFDPSTWRDLAGEQWDLVIANPPYVRYQRGSGEALGDVEMPSASQVRRGLVAVLEDRHALAPADRRVWVRMAREYGGLSDLAVPAWILCSALVAPGGRLAIVAPDTWLSRNYALPMLYLLRRYFEIEAVVEDGDAAWFPDALVRTTLLVARRVADQGSALGERRVSYPHVRLDRGSASATSAVGSLYRTHDDPERAFVDDVLRRRPARRKATGPVADRTTLVPDGQLRSLLLAGGRLTGWLTELESADGRPLGSVISSAQVVHLPQGVAGAIGRVPQDALMSLEALGWQVGQGLRTGANRFFYGAVVSDVGDHELVAVDRWLAAEPVLIPRHLLAPVLRKQQDLGRGVVATTSPGRVLVLEGYALPEDIELARRVGIDVKLRALPSTAADLVRRGATMPVGAGEHSRRVPELSAVITNVRRAVPSRPERQPRAWYHLPQFAPRHRPDVCMARVNHLSPVAVSCRGLVVDANFSTFSPAERPRLSGRGLVALLSTAWVAASLESTGTVLGGGALKVEATHLRRLPLPRLDGCELAALETIGATLVRPGTDPAQVRLAADGVIEAALVRLGARAGSAAVLRRVAADQLGRRNARAARS